MQRMACSCDTDPVLGIGGLLPAVKFYCQIWIETADSENLNLFVRWSVCLAQMVTDVQMSDCLLKI